MRINATQVIRFSGSELGIRFIKSLLFGSFDWGEIDPFVIMFNSSIGIAEAVKKEETI